MENHTFGEPVPIVHSPISINGSNNDDDVKNSDDKQDEEPSWTVDVIRKGSNVVVGTIVINNAKLPPRRNKNKKIVWKLPSVNNSNTEEDVPRFGKQDYPRLWEIYKEEKKKRRSINKTTGTPKSLSNTIDDDSSTRNDDDNLTNYKDDQNDCNDNENTGDLHEAIEDTTHSTISATTVAHYHHNSNIVDHTSTCPEQAAVLAIPSMTMIAPPPGFESTLSAKLPMNGDGCGHTPFDVCKSSTATTPTTIRPPPGFA